MTGIKVAALAAGVALVALGGCASPQKTARYMASHSRAQADIKDAEGRDVGKAVAEEIDGIVRVIVDVKGMPVGVHGTHIHAVGQCTPPDFASAGGHWNPGQRQHGKDNPAGAHAGDLPNLKVKPDGSDHITFTLPAGSFAQLMDGDGSALVVHADPDDYKTDPSGNSGKRIACGVFVPA